MHKEALLHQIITILTTDLSTLTVAAKAAHAAATHSECLPDNKYDTTGLEASYIAQGQANRAQDIRRSLDRYQKLIVRDFDNETPIRLTALVTIEDDHGSHRRVFLGPDAGGLKLVYADEECVVITPESPLGRALLGKRCGDEVETGGRTSRKMFTIIAVS